MTKVREPKEVALSLRTEEGLQEFSALGIPLAPIDAHAPQDEEDDDDGEEPVDPISEEVQGMFCQCCDPMPQTLSGCPTAAMRPLHGKYDDVSPAPQGGFKRFVNNALGSRLEHLPWPNRPMAK